MWRSPIVLKRGRSSEPLGAGGTQKYQAAHVQTLWQSYPMCQDQEHSRRDSGHGGLLEPCRAAGRWRRKVGESAFTAAEAPSRGRQPLPQAASQGAGAGGMRSSVR